MLMERLALLLSTALCILIGMHVVRADFLPAWGDVALFILVLPLAALIIAESLGRIIQNMVG